MKRFVAFTFIAAMAQCAVAAENPLSISVLKAERSSKNASYLLFAVENTSGERFEYTRWSCVFFNKEDPVHEEQSYIENVPPHGRAIQRVIQSYGGPFDKVECRFMGSRPSVRVD